MRNCFLRVLSTLDDMETTARYAFIGQVNPDTNQLQGGVVQIHYNIQGLATLDVTPFKA
jgi:eukaryotic-like serine/threonine-protein kinase